ncbi:MAG: class I SAM-dependent methyltransferase [Burkholderiaceae bacterium]|nr:class I SAM-dependent methyltransferase [Burkholderiaceae bacterium]
MHDTDSPSAWVRRWAPLVVSGARVLDVACGPGRHARFFAARGATVDAVDRDVMAGHALQDEPAIRFLAADIETGPWPYAGCRFDAVIVTNYLHRPLFGPLLAALAPGGVLIYETFAQGNAQFGKPSNPDFLLAPGELLQRCAGLHVLAYEDGVVEAPRPARLQRICARAGVTEAAQLRLDPAPG